MLRSVEIRRQVAQRLRELLPKAKGWEESADAKIGSQTADLLVKFRLGEQEQALGGEVSSLGGARGGSARSGGSGGGPTPWPRPSTSGPRAPGSSRATTSGSSTSRATATWPSTTC